MKIEEKSKKLYYQELEAKIEELNGTEKELAKIILKSFKANLSYYSTDKYNSEIKRLLDKMNTEKADFFKPLTNVLNVLLGEYQGNIFDYIVFCTEYPSYSTGYYRKPFRTANLDCHYETIIGNLHSIIELFRHDFKVLEYLSVAQYPVYNTIISNIIAYEIDNNNQEVINALKEVIYGDNNTAFLSRIMIKGIFMSHSKEAYEMMGQLLIAARLQEGLRQSIVESMDEGTLEAMKYMLKIIVDNGFIRYSSVVRVLDVWTGLGLEAANARVAKQCIQYAYECLTNEALCEEWLLSKDVNKLYMSLWAVAVKEEDCLYKKINSIMENGQTYQKITAQYLLTQSQNDRVRRIIAQKYLEETDKELRYWLLMNCTNYSYERKWNAKEQRYDGAKIQRLPELKDKNERIRQYKYFQIYV